MRNYPILSSCNPVIIRVSFRNRPEQPLIAKPQQGAHNIIRVPECIYKPEEYTSRELFSEGSACKPERSHTNTSKDSKKAKTKFADLGHHYAWEPQHPFLMHFLFYKSHLSKSS